MYPNNKKQIIDKFFEDPKDIALSKRSLFDKIIRQFYLGISERDIELYLKDKYEVKKIKNTGSRALIKSFTPSFPFEHWQMDFIDFSNEQIAKYNDNYKYILVVIDILVSMFMGGHV